MGTRLECPRRSAVRGPVCRGGCVGAHWRRRTARAVLSRPCDPRRRRLLGGCARRGRVRAADGAAVGVLSRARRRPHARVRRAARDQVRRVLVRLWTRAPLVCRVPGRLVPALALARADAAARAAGRAHRTKPRRRPPILCRWGVAAGANSAPRGQRCWYGSSERIQRQVERALGEARCSPMPVMCAHRAVGRLCKLCWYRRRRIRRRRRRTFPI